MRVHNFLMANGSRNLAKTLASWLGQKLFESLPNGEAISRGELLRNVCDINSQPFSVKVTAAWLPN